MSTRYRGGKALNNRTLNDSPIRRSIPAFKLLHDFELTNEG